MSFRDADHQQDERREVWWRAGKLSCSWGKKCPTETWALPHESCFPFVSECQSKYGSSVPFPESPEKIETHWFRKVLKWHWDWNRNFLKLNQNYFFPVKCTMEEIGSENTNDKGIYDTVPLRHFLSPVLSIYRTNNLKKPCWHSFFHSCYDTYKSVSRG